MTSGQVADFVDPVEIWKPIPGHRGYQASSLGRIRSVPRTLKDGRQAGGKVLAQQDDKDGYPTVMLAGKRVRVARAVQLAFAGPPQVLHLNDVRSDSRPENLAWGSRVENEQWKTRTERENRNGRGFVPPFVFRTTETAEQR